MDVSIVIPVYNEEESIQPLYEKVISAMEGVTDKFELILVDDGSSDNTFEYARKLAEQDSHLKVVKLKKNYGQTTGLYAGFQNASGKIIITMDGDLQNDPADIKNMMAKIEEGNDIVLGWRHDRKDSMLTRKLPSIIANWLVRKVTGIPVKDNGCAIRAYRGNIINNFPMYSEMHRLLPVITALAGAKFTQIKVKHHSRQFGHSKYGLSRIYKVLLDLVALKMVFTSFNKPLFGFGIYSIIFGFLCLLVISFSIGHAIFNTDLPLVVPIGAGTLLGTLSLTLFFLGIICHLIYRSGNLKIEKLYKIKFK